MRNSIWKTTQELLSHQKWLRDHNFDLSKLLDTTIQSGN